MNDLPKTTARLAVAVLAFFAGHLSYVSAQSVCLPAPRLLTTMPMGGQVGSTVEVTVTGESIEGAEQLRFSDPRISALPKLDADGLPLAGKYTVTISPDCPLGIHEARLMTPLGLSTSRVFSVSSLPEVIQEKPTPTAEAPMELAINTICNATMPVRAVNHYSFTANKGQRVLVECAADGIDSKLKAVLIVADEKGRDLMVERRGGAIDFTAPKDGIYQVKVHELTFNGGPEYFYRLAIRDVAGDVIPDPLPSTQQVNAFSWPPPGLSAVAEMREIEPNQDTTQEIGLPCDIAGSFYPAADVDTFEFNAKKGEMWWVEVASQRLGLPTDPSVLVQQIVDEGDDRKYVDVAELNDISSPVKVSSNGYAYDGPPYNAGSSDVLGQFQIQMDGRYRLQLRDLFGGTRNDPRNVYRMVIRKAQPDFALVGWALHMMLRNGDRNALSKPIALRPGATMALEVVVIRKDGFDGPIELRMDHLPEGVAAQGLTIPAKQSRGIMLVTAAEDARQDMSMADFYGTAEIDGQTVTRRCHLASMKWPVKDGKSEIPSPRLLADVPISVSAIEKTPLTISPQEDKVWEAKAGEKLTIPMVQTSNAKFSGANLSLSTFGGDMERNPTFDVSLTADRTEAVIDLAKTKTPPGDYTIAFYGGAVVKYAANPDAADAKTNDIADIIVTQPVHIRVLPEEKK
ncbi:serine protease [Stieleria varia]|uniref:Serine protease n=1 Tax=Stieleria varia TaxID=2528005 RepID=A0A5C6AS58_9BACT|nr:serine protease [Stieleria varia]TWU01004.1 hypothetical protein Pla52n_43750 [Stieleria varia]